MPKLLLRLAPVCLAVFLILVLVLAGGSALAAVTANETDLRPGRRTVVTYDTTGTLTLDSQCGTISVAQDAPNGGTVAGYGLRDASVTITSGALLFSLSGTSGSAPTTTAFPTIGLAVTAAPSSGTSKLFLWCGVEARGGSSGIGSLSTGTAERAIKLVGDSWVLGRERDEPWAQFGPFALHGGGFVSRMGSALGYTEGTSSVGAGNVEYAFTFTSGGLFGASAFYDILADARARPEITDYVLIVGHNDFNPSLECAHGSPFDPGAAADGPCTVAQTIANLEYVIGGLVALGRNVHWEMPPGWLGLFQDDALDETPDGATFRTAIETVHDALAAFCVGKTCWASHRLYREGCAGDTSAPDPTVTANCAGTNTVNYGDGAGLVNRLNAPILFAEDALQQSRTAGSYRLHASGVGYAAFFRVLMDQLRDDDPTITLRFTGFGLDWDSRPGVPGVTIGSTTATTIPVTVTRGAHVNGSSGDDGRCLYGACRYVCWATCVDTGGTSGADPACWDPADDDVCTASGVPYPWCTGSSTGTAQARDIGAPQGAAHAIEDVQWTVAPRDVVVLEDGATATLRRLATATDYKVACVALSPTGISHPAVRNVTTP
jgi:hypothetical protein